MIERLLERADRSTWRAGTRSQHEAASACFLHRAPRNLARQDRLDCGPPPRKPNTSQAYAAPAHRTREGAAGPTRQPPAPCDAARTTAPAPSRIRRALEARAE